MISVGQAFLPVTSPKEHFIPAIIRGRIFTASTLAKNH